MFGDSIWKATERGDLEKVRELIARDGIPIAEDDYDSRSLLTVACENGQVEIVRYLIENGYESLKYHRFAPFAFAAMEQGHIEVLRGLCEFGLDIDAEEFSKHGSTLFWTAVDEKQLEAVRLFIEYGADIEQSWWGPESGDFGYNHCLEDEYQIELLVIEKAARMGRPDMVEFFLDVGVELNGQSAESYLQRARENEPLRLEHEASRPKLTTDLDAKITIQDCLIIVAVWAVLITISSWIFNS